MSDIELRMNGLILKKVKTCVDRGQSGFGVINDLTDFLGKRALFQETTYFVAYLYHKVLIGKFEVDFKTYDGQPFSPTHLMNLRVFNKDEEVYIWRIEENNFLWRHRKDNEGDEQDVMDIEQVLWGTRAEPLQNDYSRLFETRGMELIVPFEGLQIDDKKKRLKILTRHYIVPNENHQACYVDARIVGFMT